MDEFGEGLVSERGGPGLVHVGEGRSRDVRGGDRQSPRTGGQGAVTLSHVPSSAFPTSAPVSVPSPSGVKRSRDGVGVEAGVDRPGHVSTPFGGRVTVAEGK